jgi:hypothetical protein
MRIIQLLVAACLCCCSACRGSIVLSSKSQEGQVSYRVQDSGCERAGDHVVCFIGGVDRGGLIERYTTDDTGGVVKIYLRFDGGTWTNGDRSYPVKGYVIAGGAFPSAYRVWEMTGGEFFVSDKIRLSGTLQCDRAVLVPAHREAETVEVRLRSVAMPWTDAVAEIKVPGTLKRIPALADW